MGGVEEGVIPSQHNSIKHIVSVTQGWGAIRSGDTLRMKELIIPRRRQGFEVGKHGTTDCTTGQHGVNTALAARIRVFEMGDR